VDVARGPSELPVMIAERYQILRWLGAGGMGNVYEALDTELDERVALKVVKRGLSDMSLERFRREVKLTRRIQHRNVARMFDIGEHAGDKFLTMELVDGEPLTRLGRPLAWPQMREIALQLCAGLEAAHTTGVVHRDLKPDNVLIECGTQRVVITDFGIARSRDESGMTQAGAVLGTPRYMSPEQLTGEEVDLRADLFSLGVMLFELACGTRPWAGGSAVEIAIAQATEPAQRLRANLPAEIIGVIESCLSIDPTARPASARAIEAVIVDAGDVTTRRESRPSIVPSPAQPRRTSTLAVLPFHSVADVQDLADWLHEDLVDTLSMTPELRVRPARTSLAGSELDPRELGRELAVDHVVDGSVRRIPTGLRVSARLIAVADGFQIWARRWDYSESEVLNMTNQLAREIAQALSSTTAATVVSTATDPRAIELYLRARGELRRFWGVHAQNAALLLAQALEYAPDSPEILGAFALASTQAWVRSGDPSLLAPARQAVERASAARLGEADLAAALLRMSEGDIEGGASALAAALPRAPMSAPAHETTARILAEVELVAEAVLHLDVAAGLDPGRARMVELDLGRIEGLEGDWAAADRRIASLCADPDPAVSQLGAMTESRLAGWRGDPKRSLDAARRLGDRVDERDGMYGFLARYVAGEPFDHERWATLIGNISSPHKPRRMQLSHLQRAAEIALLVAEVPAAIDAIKRANGLGLIDIVWFDRCPLLAPVRASPDGFAIRDSLAARAGRVRDAFVAATRV
jgi:eukaryotic-like serine/threonine-protein kinase